MVYCVTGYIYLLTYDLVTMTYNDTAMYVETFLLDVLVILEAKASELLKNLEGVFPCYW